jgi:sugar phosphate isomerase/epimerase
MIDIKNGIAYSGDVNECGTLKQKIDHAIENGIKYIQVRTKDIQDLIISDNKLDDAKVKELIAKVNEYHELVEGGVISLHLPNPVWKYADGKAVDVDNMDVNEFKLASSNELVIQIIKDLLLNIGIKDYTVHPHFPRKAYEAIKDEDKHIIIDKMSKYFSDIANLGVNLAIENIPVRDLSEVEKLEDVEKKKKALKNISYGMTIEEIQGILDATKAKTTNGRVGITFDTGHATARIQDFEARYNEFEKWISHFKDDIIIYHIAPNVGSDPVTLTDSARETTTKTVDWVYELSQKYSIDALTFIEAHTNFNILTEYAEIGREEKAKLANETLEDGAPGRK